MRERFSLRVRSGFASLCANDFHFGRGLGFPQNKSDHRKEWPLSDSDKAKKVALRSPPSTYLNINITGKVYVTATGLPFILAGSQSGESDITLRASLSNSSLPELLRTFTSLTLPVFEITNSRIVLPIIFFSLASSGYLNSLNIHFVNSLFPPPWNLGFSSALETGTTSVSLFADSSEAARVIPPAGFLGSPLRSNATGNAYLTFIASPLALPGFHSGERETTLMASLSRSSLPELLRTFTSLTLPSL